MWRKSVEICGPEIKQPNCMRHEKHFQRGNEETLFIISFASSGGEAGTCGQKQKPRRFYRGNLSIEWTMVENVLEKGEINVISVLIQSWNAVGNRWVKKYMWKQFYSQRAHSWNMHKAQSHQVEFNWLQLFNVVFLPPSILFALFWNGLSVCAFYNLFLLHFFQPLFSF